MTRFATAAASLAVKLTRWLAQKPLRLLGQLDRGGFWSFLPLGYADKDALALVQTRDPRPVERGDVYEDFGETDNRRRNKKGFHDNVRGWAKLIFGTVPPPNPVEGVRCQRSRQTIPAAYAMARTPSVLTQAPPDLGAGGYSPMTL